MRSSGVMLATSAKMDFLVMKLRKLGIAIAGIQRTKWFGNYFWTANVGILLDRDETAAWKELNDRFSHCNDQSEGNGT